MLVPNFNINKRRRKKHKRKKLIKKLPKHFQQFSLHSLSRGPHITFWCSSSHWLHAQAAFLKNCGTSFTICVTSTAQSIRYVMRFVMLPSGILMFEFLLVSGTIETGVPWIGDFTIEHINICYSKMQDGTVAIVTEHHSTSWWRDEPCSADPQVPPDTAGNYLQGCSKPWLIRCHLNSIPGVNSKLVLH